MCESISSFSTY